MKNFVLVNVFFGLLIFVVPVLSADNGGTITVNSPSSEKPLSGNVKFQGIWDIPPELEGDLKFTITVSKDGTAIANKEVPVTVKSTLKPEVKILSPITNEVSGEIEILAEATPPDKGYKEATIAVSCIAGSIMGDPIPAGAILHMRWDTKDYADQRCRIIVQLKNDQGDVVAKEEKEIRTQSEVKPEVRILSPTTNEVSGKIQILAEAIPADKGYKEAIMSVSCVAGSVPNKTIPVGEKLELEWDTKDFNLQRCMIFVKLMNENGGESAKQEMEVRVVNAENNPTLTFSAPGNGQTVSGMVTVTFDTKDVLMDQLELVLPSGEHAYLMKRLPYEYRWYTTESPDGEYTLNAKATKDGKEVTAQVTVKVQNQQ